ncbi:predicted protein [Sclerotinia sclerotiorum 1980 UF-70]|uniref:Uncharacterized protein n=1 Tax=Sclerotinia sclerotiorum (strain ATCC 18683 / 1980 / Ss-1) TaxID=665079 RepID=A7EIL9_SCLS1|nr:predicted protein [Sclerotinia sclerotiorum 1980 UF-70]EDO02685.1 predicted protein [Sclerotinia sclerotiorum 1980 UF-70]
MAKLLLGYTAHIKPHESVEIPRCIINLHSLHRVAILWYIDPNESLGVMEDQETVSLRNIGGVHPSAVLQNKIAHSLLLTSSVTESSLYTYLPTIKGDIDVLLTVQIRRVYDLNRQLKGIFRTYATEARGKYANVLDIIDRIGTEIADDAPLNVSDLETLRGIVQARSDLSASMKTIVSTMVDLLHKIKADLETTIGNINTNLLALNKVLVFTSAEQNKINQGPTPENIWGFGERFALVDTYFVVSRFSLRLFDRELLKFFKIIVNDAVTRAQAAITSDISPAITMMERELSSWDAISHDLTTVLQAVDDEKNDEVAELKLVDNDDILETWQKLGDIVVQDSELDY